MLLDELINFVQDPIIKSKNGGHGVLESVIGIDYLSLNINPDYELPPSKLAYNENAGACSLKSITKGPNAHDEGEHC